MKRSVLLLAVLGLVAVVVPVARAGYSAGWHWKRSNNPFNVQMINSTTGSWHDAVKKAANRWSNKSTVLNITLEDGDSTEATRRNCPAPSGGVRICNDTYPGGWAGLTEVTMNGQHMLSASVKLDDSARHAKRAVACHEIGHALGLGHRSQSATSSCMTPSVSSSQTKPDRLDYRHLKRIYKHGDGGSGTTSSADVVTEEIEVVRRGPLTIYRIYAYPGR